LKNNKFGICLTSIDGRLQLPVLEWIKSNYNVEYVDMITERNMIEIFTKNMDRSIDDISKKIKHSIRYNKSKILFVVGYHKCPN